MSEQSLQKNTQKFVSSREAAKRFGVTHDYIARLCRKGQLTGSFDNGKWLVDMASLESFFVARAPQAMSGAAADYITSKAAARMYRVTNDYIARLCKQGKLVAKRTDRTWLVEQNSLNAFFAQRPAYVEAPDVSEITRAPQQWVRSVVPPQTVAPQVSARAPRYAYVVAAVVGVMVLGASAFAVSRVGSSDAQVAGAWSGFAQAVHNFFFGADRAVVQEPPVQTVVTYATTTTPTIVQQKTYPATERIVERLVTQTVSGVSQIYLDQQLNALRSQVAGISSGSSGVVVPYAPALRLDKLSGVAITGGSLTNATISGGSLSGVSLSTGDLSGVVGIANGGIGTSSAPSYGQVLLGNASGTYDLVATSSLGIVSSGGSSSFAFTPTTNFGATANSTSTPVWFTAGLQASSTSHFANLDYTGTLNFASTSANASSTLFSLNGQSLLVASTTGFNTGFGLSALTKITNGNSNTAFGANALIANTSGNSNTAVGYALVANTSGNNNTAVGDTALEANTTGARNVGIGQSSVTFNTTGNDNIGIGYLTIGGDTGNGNVAVGSQTLLSQTSGSYNTALGYKAGDNISSGSNNVFVGKQAGSSLFSSAYSNIIIGDSVTNLNFGHGNIGLGSNIYFGNSNGNSQLNIGGILFGTLPATSTAFLLPTSGSIGVGTSSPFAKFSIAANNGDTATTLFAIGSSTASATTTLFSVTNKGTINTNLNSGTTTLITFAGQTFLTTSNSLANISLGRNALTRVTTGYSNSAFGDQSLQTNVSGFENTAVGNYAMGVNDSGSNNAAFGASALSASVSGSFNVAIGQNALLNSAAPNRAVAVGFYAGSGQGGSQTGAVSLGYKAGFLLDAGADYNTLLGYQAGSAVSTGYANILVGASVTANNLTTGLGNVGIGNELFFPSATGNNQLNLGGLLFGTLPATSTTFRLPTSGSLGVGTSSPFAKFSIQSNNGDTAQTLFAIGSSTASATTTLFSVSNIGSTTLFQIPSSILKTNANGTIVAAVAGTDYQTFAFPFTSTTNFGTVANSTTTPIWFTAGLQASSTSHFANLDYSGTLNFASTSVNASSTLLGFNGQSLLVASSTAFNTGLGLSALTAVTTGTQNTALGYQTLSNVTSSVGNTAVGYLALKSLTDTVVGNVAIGANTLQDSTFGEKNVAVGYQTLQHDTLGYQNIAIGYQAMNTGGSTYDVHDNIAIGTFAGISVSGPRNTLVGFQSGYSITSGYSNTLVGDHTVFNSNSISTGGGNVGLGSNIFFPSLTGNSQLNVGNILFGTLPATSTAFRLPTSGSLGVGTSSPFAKFSIQSNNGDTATTLFAIGSSTASATTTLFSVSNTGLASILGGLTVFASSTIGNGTQGGGLTISGGATTTGNAYFAGNVGIGTSTSVKQLIVAGTSAFNTLDFSNNALLGQYEIYENSSANPGAYFRLVGTNNPGGSTRTGIAELGAATSLAFRVSSFTEAARFDSSGNFGIGTTTPTTLFGGTFASAGPIFVGGASTTATSTIEGNLLVQGTLKVGLNSTYISEDGIQTTNNAPSFDINTTVGTSLSISQTGFGTTTLAGLNISGQATSTSNVGFNLTSGCYAIQGTCLPNSTSLSTAIAAAYPFALSGNATSTLTQFNGGLTAYASSTIGNGTAGLTVSGNSTTTGIAYFANNVGIGTTSPAKLLTIASNAPIAALDFSSNNLFAAYELYQESSANPGGYLRLMGTNNVAGSPRAGSLELGSATSLSFRVSSFTEAARFDTAGSFGIGSTTPWARLSVDTSSLAASVPSFVVGSSTRTDLIVTQAGNVGIGTTTPSANLFVSGRAGQNILQAGTSTNQYLFTVNSSGNTHIGTLGSANAQLLVYQNSGSGGASDAAFTVRQDGTNPIAIFQGVAGIEYARITAGGSVGIGTSTPAQALSVVGRVYTTSGVQFPDGTFQSSAAAGASSGTQGQFAYYASNGTTVSGTSTFTISTAGNVSLGTTSPFAKFSIHANSGGANTTLFAIGSSTASATTTLFAVTNTGNVTVGNNAHLNFGTLYGPGSGGYGIRENGGMIEFRNAYASTTVLASNWTPISAAASVRYQLNESGWVNTGATLPITLNYSQTVVVGDYIYLLGGGNTPGYTNKILRAPLSNPTSWVDTGATVPAAISVAQSVTIGDYIYLFGGYNGTSYQNTIYRAPIANPTSWVNTGSTLPSVLGASHVAVIGDYVYLFGGYNGTVDSTVIYRAPVSNPTSWTDTGAVLPGGLSYSQLHVIGDYVYLFGGSNTNVVNVIYRAPVSSPTSWSNTGSTLPVALGFAQSAIIGDYVYIFGGYNGSAVVNTIYRAPVSNPTSWSNTGSTLSSVASNAQVVVAGDSLYLYGGSDSSFNSQNIILRTTISSNTGAFDKSYATRLNAPTGPWAFATSTSGSLSFTAGNVGIGTTTPGAKLNVLGALCVDDATPTCANAARTAGTIYAVATAITGIDLAERYPTKDTTLAAGELVGFDPANPVFVSRATSTADFLGVVSTAPGIELGGYNEELYVSEKKLPVALAGRVPVKVNLDGGVIAVGDAITISMTPGVGAKATTTTQTIGVALEPYDGSGTSTVQVFIKPELTFVDSDLATLKSLVATTTHEVLVQSSFVTATDALKSAMTSAFVTVEGVAQSGVRMLGKAVYATIGTFNYVFADHIIATDITADLVTATQKLCVGTTCVTEAQLQQLLNIQTAQASGGQASSTSTDSTGSLQTTPPTIYINGNNPATIHIGDSYSDLGATATDSEGHELTVHTFVNGVSLEPATLDTSTAGTSTIDYVATDTWGNTATSTRTVIILGNTLAPTVEEPAPAEATAPVIQEPAPTEVTPVPEAPAPAPQEPSSTPPAEPAV